MEADIKVGDLVRRRQSEEIGIVIKISDIYDTIYVSWRGNVLKDGFYLRARLVPLSTPNDRHGVKEEIILL